MQVKLTSGQIVEAVQVGGNVFQVIPKGRKPLHRGSFTILNPTACTDLGCGNHTDHETFPLDIILPDSPEEDLTLPDSAYGPEGIYAHRVDEEDLVPDSEEGQEEE